MVEALFNSGSILKKNGDDIQEVNIADAITKRLMKMRK